MDVLLPCVSEVSFASQSPRVGEVIIFIGWLAVYCSHGLPYERAECSHPGLPKQPCTHSRYMMRGNLIHWNKTYCPLEREVILPLTSSSQHPGVPSWLMLCYGFEVVILEIRAVAPERFLSLASSPQWWAEWGLGILGSCLASVEGQLSSTLWPYSLSVFSSYAVLVSKGNSLPGKKKSILDSGWHLHLTGMWTVP